MENPRLDVLTWPGSQLVLAHQTLIDPEMIQIHHTTFRRENMYISNIHMPFFLKTLKPSDMGFSFFAVFSYSNNTQMYRFCCISLPTSVKYPQIILFKLQLKKKKDTKIFIYRLKTIIVATFHVIRPKMRFQKDCQMVKGIKRLYLRRFLQQVICFSWHQKNPPTLAPVSSLTQQPPLEVRFLCAVNPKTCFGGFAPSPGIEWFIIKVRPGVCFDYSSVLMSEASGMFGVEGLLVRQYRMWRGTSTCECSDHASVDEAKARRVSLVFRTGGSNRALKQHPPPPTSIKSSAVVDTLLHKHNELHIRPINDVNDSFFYLHGGSETMSS